MRASDRLPGNCPIDAPTPVAALGSGFERPGHFPARPPNAAGAGCIAHRPGNAGAVESCPGPDRWRWRRRLQVRGRPGIRPLKSSRSRALPGSRFAARPPPESWTRAFGIPSIARRECAESPARVFCRPRVSLPRLRDLQSESLPVHSTHGRAARAVVGSLCRHPGVWVGRGRCRRVNRPDGAAGRRVAEPRGGWECEDRGGVGFRRDRGPTCLPRSQCTAGRSRSGIASQHLSSSFATPSGKPPHWRAGPGFGQPVGSDCLNVGLSCRALPWPRGVRFGVCQSSCLGTIARRGRPAPVRRWREASAPGRAWRGTTVPGTGRPAGEGPPSGPRDRWRIDTGFRRVPATESTVHLSPRRRDLIAGDPGSDRVRS